MTDEEISWFGNHQLQIEHNFIRYFSQPSDLCHHTHLCGGGLPGRVSWKEDGLLLHQSSLPGRVPLYVSGS